jgi:hypothetical protein
LFSPQNNIKRRKPNKTIVQENAKIVQTCINRAFLDDFVMDFGRLFYPLFQEIAIFAAEKR